MMNKVFEIFLFRDYGCWPSGWMLEKMLERKGPFHFS
jgi:hypothetical protein